MSLYFLILKLKGHTDKQIAELYVRTQIIPKWNELTDNEPALLHVTDAFLLDTITRSLGKSLYFFPVIKSHIISHGATRISRLNKWQRATS